MRKILLFLVVPACSVVILGCPKKPGADGDAASDAAVVEAPIDAAAAPPVNAKNAADVARFAAETAVTDAAKTLSVATVRTSPKGGNVVATLKVGTDVTKVAEYQGSFLITFADPKDANSTLMGWVGKEGFSAWVVRPKDAGLDGAVAVVDAGAPVVVVDAGPAKLTCAAGSVAVVLTKDPVCKRKCTKDADCKAGTCAPANSQAGGVVKVCAGE